MPATPPIGPELVVGPAFVIGGTGEEEAAGPGATTGVASGATVDVSIRLQALDGTWETCGADRAIGVEPETLTYSHNEWGADKASFDLHRSVIALWPDLGAFTPVEIEVGGVIVWEGRTSETPTRAGAEQIINVQCEGWQYDLDDDVYQRVYVHSKLTDWKDCRSSLTADLTHFNAQPQVGAQQGMITLGWAKGGTVAGGNAAGVVLDLGPGNTAKRVVLTLDGSGVSDGAILLYARAVESLGEAFTTANDAITALSAKENGTFAGTFATAMRYVTVFLYYNGEGGTFPADNIVKLTAISVFADTAYESGNASVLHASTIAKDALERATLLLSPDLSQIAATSFPIPDFAMSKASTPREAIEAANAYHNYIAKLLSGRRVSYQPRPTDPLLEIGAWSGAEIEDASANNGAEIYNRALVEAQGPDGSPLSVERAAVNEPGANFTATGSPSPDNPSFATSAASWTVSSGSITRDTTAGHYHSAPAAGNWKPGAAGESLTETFSGTFLAGVTYLLTFWMNGPALVAFRFGTATDNVAAAAFGVSEYTARTIAWTPAKSVAGATLTLTTTAAAEMFIDDLSLVTSQPTLVDRRGFRRTKVIQPSSAITTAEGNQLADIFLQGHMTTPFKGAASVSPGGVRRVLGGQPVHPSQLGLHAQELLRVSHMTDPDTGGIGRDGTIAEVSYTHKDQKAQVTLDDKRGNFDALLARLAVVQSVGS